MIVWLGASDHQPMAPRLLSPPPSNTQGGQTMELLFVIVVVALYGFLMMFEI